MGDRKDYLDDVDPEWLPWAEETKGMTRQEKLTLIRKYGSMSAANEAFREQRENKEED